jgi:hypothetical protein
VNRHIDPQELTPELVAQRIDQLAAWPTSLVDTDNDPRCDCDPDCYWNSIGGVLSKQLDYALLA